MSFCFTFPAEIIDSISGFLSTQDLVSVVLVCRAWNYSFSPSIYRNISLSDPRQFHRLYSILAKSSTTNTPFGNYVRNLDILDGRAIQAGIGQLPVLCPHITALKVTQKWASRVNSIVCVNDGALERTTKALLHTFVTSNRLNSLSLNFYRRIDLDILPQLSNLQHLSLGWLNQGISPATLQTIHAQCPLLKILALDGLDRINEPQQGLTSSTLQSLSLHFRKGIQCDEAWLVYISHTYPRLSHLSLEAPAQYSESVDFAPLLIPSAYHRFASQAKHLRQLELIHTIRHKILIDLLHSYHVPLASLVLQTKFGFPRDFCDTLFNVFPSLTLLSAQGHPRYRDCNEPVRSLSNFSTHLRHLNLGQWDTVHLETILGVLPNLTHLTLQDSILLTGSDCPTYNNNNSNIIDGDSFTGGSNLESLVLERISLPCDGIVEIRGTCLKHLVLRHCTAPHQNLKIKLPGVVLSRVEIDELCVGQPVWKSDRVVKSVTILGSSGSFGQHELTKAPSPLEIECESVWKLLVNQKNVQINK
ncbi:hypothetical protein J3Q64DRAFT_1720580 [Phycomyces blakesleeanus]|uniref:F-box domain-containing protein n=1 Tax=Phycomyces blakesleeanus TaxID=4837 RepID=A0ABR3BAQ8_PHYBL